MKFLGNPSSGSQANSTFSHNRAGQYTRNRRTPVNPVGTGRRATVRSFFSAASKYYASLTGSQQAAWAAYAGSYPYVDSLGQSIVLTGHQMCVAINVNLQNVGHAMVATPPVSNATIAPSIVTFTAVSAGAITLTLAGAGLATDYVLEAFSAPQSSGTGFCKTFWQQTHVAANLGTAQILTTGYEAQFGIPTAGTRIFYRLTPVNQYGVAGSPVEGFVTVT